MDTLTVIELVFALWVLAAGVVFLRRNMERDMHGTFGDFRVVGEGETVIDRPLKRSRGFLSNIEERIKVEFASGEPECPPCVPHEHDQLSWDIVSLHSRSHIEHCHCGKEEMYVKVKWHVAGSRTVLWSIRDVR